jgi:hypothetical protein
MSMKRGDRVPLSCGHLGRVVWVRADGTTMAVQGQRRSCPVCCKGSGSSQTLTVYLLPVA